jgi:primosomal protein N' (replication factor Y)
MLRVEVLGPAPSPLAKIRNRHRWQVLLKAPDRRDLHRLLATYKREMKVSKMMRVAIDVDPVDML